MLRGMARMFLHLMVWAIKKLYWQVWHETPEQSLSGKQKATGAASMKHLSELLTKALLPFGGFLCQSCLTKFPPIAPTADLQAPGQNLSKIHWNSTRRIQVVRVAPKHQQVDSRCGLFDGIAVLHGQISVGSDDIPEANIDVEPNKIIFR